MRAPRTVGVFSTTVVGIVRKNGILMLDSEKHYTSQGYALDEAIPMPAVPGCDRS